MSSVQTTVARVTPLTPIKLALLALIRAYQWTVGPGQVK